MGVWVAVREVVSSGTWMKRYGYVLDMVGDLGFLRREGRRAALRHMLGGRIGDFCRRKTKESREVFCRAFTARSLAGLGQPCPTTLSASSSIWRPEGCG